MPTITKKGQVTIPKPLREKDDLLVLKKKERKSILSLGGIAKGRKVGVGREREYTKKVVSRRIAKEGLKDG